jgi:hypothetical protein
MGMPMAKPTSVVEPSTPLCQTGTCPGVLERALKAQGSPGVLYQVQGTGFNSARDLSVMRDTPLVPATCDLWIAQTATSRTCRESTTHYLS